MHYLCTRLHDTDNCGLCRNSDIRSLVPSCIYLICRDFKYITELSFFLLSISATYQREKRKNPFYLVIPKYPFIFVSIKLYINKIKERNNEENKDYPQEIQEHIL